MSRSAVWADRDAETPARCYATLADGYGCQPSTERTFRAAPGGEARAPLPGFYDKVISMYAPGMTTGETRGHVDEVYGLSVSAELVSKVTDTVHEEIRGVAGEAAGWRLRVHLL